METINVMTTCYVLAFLPVFIFIGLGLTIVGLAFFARQKTLALESQFELQVAFVEAVSACRARKATNVGPVFATPVSLATCPWYVSASTYSGNVIVTGCILVL